MAHIQIPLRDSGHITLFHFDKLTDEHRSAISKSILELVTANRGRPVTARYGRYTMMGPRRNIPAQLVISDAIMGIREGLERRLEAKWVPWSSNYDFTPHHSRPGLIAEGQEVKLLPYIDFIDKKAGLNESYEM